MLLYDQFVHYDHEQGDQMYACCPLHPEKTPSFTVNKNTGEWYCHGCGRGGAEKEFIMDYFDVPFDVATNALSVWEAKGFLPFPDEQMIKRREDYLWARSREVEALKGYGISEEVIRQMRIGMEDLRYTIPIKSRTGQWVNIRKYLPPHHRDGALHSAKCLNIRGLGSKRFYPYEAFDEQEIYIVEGEKDCLVARSQGLNAVTGTGGSNIPTEELFLFKDKDVILMLDTDRTGEKNSKAYRSLLATIARSIRVVTLPEKDFSDFWAEYHTTDLSEYEQSAEAVDQKEQATVAEDISLVRSEFTDQLNTWVNLRGMSVVGVESKIYTVPTKLRMVCRNAKCQKPCALASANPVNSEVTVDPRQMLQFIDASDNAQDAYVRKIFGCRSVQAEPIDHINIQKLIFQESASFIDGLEEASFENRFGIYMYTDYRLSATLKYNFEACRVTNPKTQQNYYLIRSAESVTSAPPAISEDTLGYFQENAKKFNSGLELMDFYYQQWKPSLGIEGRLDLFGALLLTYCSVTEIPWAGGLIKGWLDTMVIGDTRTGKSQMAQRFVKTLGMGGYINGENARSTGVIGGVQKFGESWVVTWGAIPMNDRGLLVIDEASGLDVEDIKNLSSTRSSGAVTLNKIVKGEARARTRLLWLSNPRSGRNLNEFYWRGYGAFQEFIPVAEDQARYDLVLTAAREDVDVLDGIPEGPPIQVAPWKSLFATAWSIPREEIVLNKSLSTKVREVAKKLNEDFGGGTLVVGVAVHEKLLRLTCAFAVLCGSFSHGKLHVEEKHLQFADEFLRMTLDKKSFGYGAYIREFKRAQKKKVENVAFIRGLVTEHPALKVLLSSSGFKGFQFQEILGLERAESSKIMSALIVRGLLRPTAGATYVPDKMLMDIAKEMDI